jgi:tripartite-type tricarboxylate transporter receptor subunit TctC
MGQDHQTAWHHAALIAGRPPRLSTLETIMKLLRRGFLHLAAGAAVLPAVLRAAWAQAYPTRPITMVVPYAAGGPADAIARIVAERMRGALGQTVVIENITGAGGSVGVGRVARAAPDGYTLGIGNWGSNVANGALYALQYDLLTDFEPVSMLPSEPNLILAKQAIPANTLPELIAWLKANADKATGGTSGVGGPSHVAGILFQKEAGVRFQLVPYRGAGPAIQDLAAGQIDTMITGPSIALSLVRDGKIKAYAVTAKSRLAAEPDIPTTDEAGMPGFYIAVWHGLWAPKGTAREIIAKLNAAVRDTLADPAVRQRLAGLSLEIPSLDQQTPEGLYAHHKAEIEKWWPIIKAANIKGE